MKARICTSMTTVIGNELFLGSNMPALSLKSVLLCQNIKECDNISEVMNRHRGNNQDKLVNEKLK